MSINVSPVDVAKWLRVLGTAVQAAEPIAAGLNPIAGAVIAAVGAGLELGASFADQGKEPYVEITRLIDADKDFDAATATIDAYARGKQ